jgi:tRNA1Val (adenine37-N6)-methyltransferase
MKVCTDACLFGAYIAETLQSLPVNNILDIGAGTGLLSLMLAQKTTPAIDSIEIDAAAFAQAKENIAQSVWKEKITIFNKNVLQFESGKKYDCIISNPPFFEADLKSDDEKKNFAKHDTSLTLIDLLKIIDNHLTAEGFFALLLPYHRSNYFEEAAAQLNFHLTKKLLIKQTPKHNYFRVILIFCRNKSAAKQSELIIKNENGSYSYEFTKLLKDYYLYL